MISSLLFSLIFLLLSASISPHLTLPDSCKGFTISNSTSLPINKLDCFVDINGDGIPDIIVSDNQHPNPSTLYIIYGTQNGSPDIDALTMTSKQGFRITGLALYNTHHPNSSSCTGDINGDGVTDLVIAASTADDFQGAVYVIYGKKGGYKDFNISNLTPSMGFKISGGAQTGNIKPNDNLTFKQRFLEESNSVQTSLKNAVYGSSIMAYIINRILNIWSPTQALPYIYAQLRNSLLYLRYLNISRTQKLMQVFQLYEDSDINIIPFVGLRDSWKDAFPTLPLPSVFQQYDLPSTFIVNFGDKFLCLFITLLAFLLVHLTHSVIQKYFKSLSTLISILYRTSIILQNFLIGSFLQSLGPIIFSATIEFRNHPKGKLYYALSPVSCYLSLLIAAFLMLFHIYLLHKLKTFRKDHTRNSKEHESLHGKAVLFKEFKDSSFLHQAAFLFFNLRAIVEGLIIGLLFEYPQAQTAVLLVHNLVILIYLAYKRPLKSSLDLAQQIFLMILLFICNCSAAQMARSDQNTTSENFNDIKESTSNIIYTILILFQFIPLPFFLIKLIQIYWKSQTKTSPNQQETNAETHNHSFASPEMSPEQPTGMTTQAHFLTERVSLVEQDAENPVEKSVGVIVEESSREIDLEISQPSLAERTFGLQQSKKRRLIKKSRSIWEDPEKADKALQDQLNRALEINLDALKKEGSRSVIKPARSEAVNDKQYGVDFAIKMMTKPRQKQPRKARWIKPLREQVRDSLYSIDDLYNRPKKDESNNNSGMISHMHQNPEPELVLKSFSSKKLEESGEGSREKGPGGFKRKEEAKDFAKEDQSNGLKAEEKLEGQDTENGYQDLEIKEEEDFSKESGLENSKKEEEDEIGDGIGGLVDEDELKDLEMKKDFEKDKEEEKKEGERMEDVALDFELKEAEILMEEIEKELEDEKTKNLLEEKKAEEKVGSFEKSLMKELGGSDLEEGDQMKAEQKSCEDDLSVLIKAIMDTTAKKMEKI